MIFDTFEFHIAAEFWQGFGIVFAVAILMNLIFWLQPPFSKK